MGIGFFCVLGLVAIAFATRSYRFWTAYSLAFVGSAMLFIVSTSFGTRLEDLIDGVDSFDPPTWIVAATGAGLLALAVLQRAKAIASTLVVLGGCVIFLAVAVARNDLYSAPPEMFAAILAPGAIATLTFAVMRYKSRLAVTAAFLALIATAFIGHSGLLDSLRDAIDEALSQAWVSGYSPLRYVPVLALSAVATAAIAGLALIGPNHVATRVALYVLIALVPLAFTGDWSYWIEQFLPSAQETPNGGANHPIILLEVIRWSTDLVCIGALLAIARRRLFILAQTEASGRAPDVFISYKREERPRVEAIAEALRALKLSVWFDAKLVAGKTFDDEINQQLRTAKTVLVCWSRSAVASDWVRAEASIARERGVLKACFLEPCDLTPPFNLVHAENLSVGALDGSNLGWVRLVDQIGHAIGRPGLGAYLTLGNDAAARKAWLEAFSADPLCADARLAV